MTDHDETARFFDEEAVRKAFGHPDWPRGTEIVCFCRRSDSRDIIEQVALRCGWVITGYRYIDDSPVAAIQKPGQVLFALRSAVEWKQQPISMTGFNAVDEQAKGFTAKQMDNPGVMTIPRHTIRQMERDYLIWRSQMLGGTRPSDWTSQDKPKE